MKYDPVRYANLLTEVGKVLPNNVWLTNLSVEPSTTTVTMSGVAAHRPGKAPLATIAEFMQNMDKSEIFTEASLASTAKTQVENTGTGFTFQIEATYDPDEAAGIAEDKPEKAESKEASADQES